MIGSMARLFVKTVGSSESCQILLGGFALEVNDIPLHFCKNCILHWNKHQHFYVCGYNIYPVAPLVMWMGI
jgi:hypothetical protein